MDGDVTAARLLLVPGHETVGTVIDVEHGVDPIPRWRSLARPQVP
jgi:D-arabinose 1-dehydrogenase-like Zn-dependent alcohol dehydrogenase